VAASFRGWVIGFLDISTGVASPGARKSRLVLSKKTGDMQLFLYDLDDLHQLDFFRNQQMVNSVL
jgi:hypothetical protein